jgi:cell division septum initiation protein DivIVA
MFNKDLKDEIVFLRQQVLMLQERNDRLTEALARKSDVHLSIPSVPVMAETSDKPLFQPPAFTVSTVPSDAEVLAARARSIDGWWRDMTSGGKVATPPQEQKVSAPQNH